MLRDYAGAVDESSLCRYSRGNTDHTPMRSKPVTVKIPGAIADALELLLANGTLGPYPSRNAAIVGLLTYAAAFPKLHALTVGIAQLPPADQDAVHDFILESVRHGADLAGLLPKPATAAALLELAKRKR